MLGLPKRSAKSWRELLRSDLITADQVNMIKNIDPTPTKKYTNWMCNVWLNEKVDLDTLRNYVEEFFTTAEKNRIENKDIYSYPNFESLKNEVDKLNERETASLKDLENKYDIIRDDDTVFIAVPYTHEASRKLGFTYFQGNKGNSSECAWCTTYKNSSHFNSYYYDSKVTFYYVKLKDLTLLKLLPTTYDFRNVAIVVHSSGKIEAYDNKDSLINITSLNKFRNVIGI